MARQPTAQQAAAEHESVRLRRLHFAKRQRERAAKVRQDPYIIIIIIIIGLMH